MVKVPITDVINSWLAADNLLYNKCKEEDCEYHSDSAYRGYMTGYEDGVNTQVVEGDKANIHLISKAEIVKAKRELMVSQMCKYVSEEDCMKHISSSDEYWFLAGAMWMIEQMNK